VLVRELSVPGAFLIEPRIHSDDRGDFLEFYRFDTLSQAVGHPLDLRQGNISVSRRGTLRGVHFADVPRGQAKYVTVVAGSAIDYVVDLRVGSPDFGRWEAVPLDDVDRRAVYIPEGMGHAFLALEDRTVLSYLVTDIYRPGREHAVNPFDPDLGLDFGTAKDGLLTSPKDADAPLLREALESGILPRWEDCVAWTSGLDSAADANLEEER
jgi:dTDP-4-dehydrorhamnose 3,5-epimerase